MENEETLTDDTQVDASQLNAAAGDEAESLADNLTLAEINALTGKDYKDKGAALKSIVDMSKQAGKAADLEGKLKAYEQAKSETSDDQTTDEVATLREEMAAMKTDQFFAQNPDHAENRDLLEALAFKNNVSLREAVELPAYKGVMDKIAAPEKRTVAASNNRVSSTPAEDPISEAVKSGDRMAMAKAVTDAFITKH